MTQLVGQRVGTTRSSASASSRTPCSPNNSRGPKDGTGSSAGRCSTRAREPVVVKRPVVHVDQVIEPYLRQPLPTAAEPTGKCYRVRGLNPDRLEALRDGRIALVALRQRFEPADIVVVGHSMGGRVAAHLAASGDVGAVAALAPWWPAADADLVPVGCRLLTLHGTADTWTDPVAARAQTVRAQERGVDARWVAVEGGGHFLLRDYPWWHRVTADFAMAQLAERSTP